MTWTEHSCVRVDRGLEIASGLLPLAREQETVPERSESQDAVRMILRIKLLADLQRFANKRDRAPEVVSVVQCGRDR